MQKPVLWLGTGLLAILVPLDLPARAANFTLSDNNSEIRVSDRNGVTVWYVEGSPDNVFIANYYYRLGSTGNENNFLDGLGTPTVNQSSPNQLELTYRGSELQAVVNYSLQGGAVGSNQSLLSRSVMLTNIGGQDLDFHLFDYSDFDIKFNQLNQRDQAIALEPQKIVVNSATQPLSILAEVSPNTTNYQISDFITLYNKFFNDLDGPTTLDNTPPLFTPFPVPPGDNALAFQWDFTLPAGAALTFSSSANYGPTVPEASSILGLISLGLLGLRKVSQ